MAIDISPGFAIVAAMIYLLDEEGIFALMAVSAALHELGHYAVLCIFGAKPYMLRLEITGAVMYFDNRGLRCWQELAAAAAGPAAGIVFALAAAFGGANALAGVSILLSLFNLLPVSWMDGGRMMAAALGALGLEHIAERAGFASSALIAVLLIGSGVISLILYRSGSAFVAAGAVIAAKLMKLRFSQA